MTSHSFSHPTADEGRPHRSDEAIDASLDELERFVVESPSRDETLKRVIAELSNSPGAVAGAIWARRDGRITTEAQWIFEPGSSDSPLSSVPVAGVVESLFRNTAQGDLASGARHWSDANYSYFLCGVRDAGDVALVVGLITSPGLGDGIAELQAQLAAIAEILEGWLTRQDLHRTTNRESVLATALNFSRAVAGRATSAEAAHWIANEGRAAIECDRLTVLLRHGKRLSVSAVSGLPVIDTRSATVRAMESLAEWASGLNEPIWVPGAEADRLPQLADAGNRFLDETGVQSFCLVPLHSPAISPARSAPENRGILLVEYFGTVRNDGVPAEERIRLIAEQAEVALEAPARVEEIPFARGLARLSQSKAFLAARLRPITLILLLGLAAAIALTVIPGTLWIEAPGELQPRVRQLIMAPRPARIVEVFVRDGDLVTVGQRLVVLRDDKLDYELTRVRGRIRAAREALLAARTQRITTENGRDRPGSSSVSDIASREVELVATLEALDEEEAVLVRQRDELILKSPIDGRVITWDVASLLVDRPVSPGQILLRVADLEGPWGVETFVPDDRVGHLVAARQGVRDLDVTFILESDPGRHREGTMTSLAAAIDDHTEYGPSAMALVLPKEPLATRRPGAAARVKIDCGRRALGYVWFHDVLDFVRRKIWF
jgi:hypothetical protein